ncbi:methyltransferase [Acrasis kona]|uniref:Methyltransferase n=1 Tax=Acrasis kona TaxID=1008807 RepID=A0AAW2YTX9_9EUKA
MTSSIKPEQSSYSFKNEHIDVGPLLTDEKLKFLQAYSKEEDLRVLKKRVIDVRKESIEKNHVYRCIQHIMFLETRFDKHQLYPEMINKLKTDQSSRILELGCCFGTDVRKLLMDGVSSDQIVASDLIPDFWNLGKKLYQDDQIVNQIKTVWGDFATSNAQEGVDIEKENWNSSFDFIASWFVLHVFSKQQCENFLKNVFKCLKNDGVYVGMCALSEKEGEWLKGENTSSTPRYLHSVSSLKSLLQGIGFSDVHVNLAENKNRSQQTENHIIGIFDARRRL